jgi:hypothetical protein
VATPTGVEDLTPAWLGAVLGWPVAAVEVTPIGTGQIADSVRLGITWADGAGSGERPVSLVAKVTTASPTSRATAMATRTYEVEAGFYNDLASTLAVRTPRCWWAGHDQATGAYGVLLEDLAPAVQGDQVAGCSVDDAALALDEAALLHGSRWGDPALRRLAWLDRGSAGGGVSGLLAALLPGFLERYADRLSPDVVALAERFVPRAGAYGAGANGARTVVHADFRNDNLMFGGGGRVCVLDWQTVGLGAAVSDVSYFLGGSLLPDVRRAHERDLVRSYWERLVAQPGVELTWDGCWEDYRRFAFGGLVMAVIASMIVVRTERGDDMFVAMAERAGCHAIDLDAEGLLPCPA